MIENIGWVLTQFFYLFVHFSQLQEFADSRYTEVITVVSLMYC